MESTNDKPNKKKNPRANANILSIITFSWNFPLFWAGYKRDLTIDDMPEPLKEHHSKFLGDKLEKVWNDELLKGKHKKKEPSFLFALLKVFGWDLILYGMFCFLNEIVLRILQPMLLGGLIRYYSQPGMTKEEAYMYAGGLIVCSILTIVIHHPFAFSVSHCGMKVRIASSSLLYRKALKLSKSALGQTTAGQIVNLLSNDVSRFDFAFLFIHFLWIGPVQTCLIAYLMWTELGLAALFGITSLLLFIPFQGWLGKRASSLCFKTAGRTDKRVRLMNEIVSGIQIIKMYAWEKPFAHLAEIARRYEFLMIDEKSWPLNRNTTNEKVDTEYNSLIKHWNNENMDIVHTAEHFTGKNDKAGIFIKNATGKWSKSSHENALSNISFDVIPGVLTALIGPVGSGKTSLFHAILKELPLTDGSIHVNGQLSYACQEPWLFHGTIRQNILFGLDYNRERYRQVVKVCSLQTDFEQLPQRDKTIVGERGVSLSGGQRARINLARAVYKEADIYLLDDPLSAVDTHVGKRLFEDCIEGYLKKKGVILVTHQLQYLENVDQIVLLENGTISAMGSMHSLRNSGLDFTQLISPEGQKEIEEHPIRTRIRRQSSIQHMASSSVIKEIRTEFPVADQTKGSVSGKVYKEYISSCGGCCRGLFLLFLCIFTQALASGGDYWITYWVNLEEYYYNEDNIHQSRNNSPYFRSCDVNNTNCSANVTYEDNINKSLTEFHYPFIASRETCIYVFSGITIATIIIILARSYLFFNSCMKASIRLHNKMFESIIRARMCFFNNNTSGRILNRFSKDIGAIDIHLPSCMLEVIQITMNLLAIIIVMASVNPLLLVPTSAAGMIIYFFRNLYLATSRSVKRLESASRSPVLTHLNASIQGLTTIRAFKAEGILIKEFDNHQDLHSSAWYIFLSSSRTFAYWSDMVCLIYTAIVTLSFLVLGGEIHAGNVGLAISQAFGLTNSFQWGIRQSAELENQMTSVERVVEYSNLESEPPLESSPDKKPIIFWPNEGRIEFSGVTLCYSRNGDWVLKNLSFEILPKQKVGIVGRTGAGKSSLISAIFRLFEVDGSIIIDGVETSTIGLHDLRSKISIIPQEPILFCGTLRKNLDPFQEYADDVLWRALDEVELKEFVKELPDGLQAEISEGGLNMSLGQRQLICLARAIIRNNKILVLDEATANVDPQTDLFIQETIRKKFADCTVLTIAHRLITVMDSDKILVMDAGTMVEFNHPSILLKNKNGFFYKMVQETGKATAEALIKIANDNYERKQCYNNLNKEDNSVI